MFGSCFHLYLCRFCNSGSKHSRPFPLAHPAIRIYFVDTVCFRLKAFFVSCECFLCCSVVGIVSFIHLPLLHGRCTQTSHSWKLKLNFGIQWCMITFGILLFGSSAQHVLGKFYFSPNVFAYKQCEHGTDDDAIGKIAVCNFPLISSYPYTYIHAQCTLRASLHRMNERMKNNCWF